ncbi:hypothetical protein [Pantoea sp. BAV 3049]|uniref:hypothetical protein n=1 Tax=Pantoea sp. BAV 3049 TaxID=2654188 RepID=UPI00131DAB61|nr:hypothetical protein [Pantoea sp. BAV 3049]
MLKKQFYQLMQMGLFCRMRRAARRLQQPGADIFPVKHYAFAKNLNHDITRCFLL